MNKLKINDEFKNWIKELLQDDKSNLCITFTKKDGTVRDMYCTLSGSKIPAEKQPKSQEANSESSGSAYRVFDTQKQEWRSFRWDSIVKVNHEPKF
jgi:hypothetical protein